MHRDERVTDEMVEVAARAMCEQGGFDPVERMPNDGPRWRYYCDGARAALSAALSIEQTEPVAWLGRGGIYRDRLFSDRQMAQSWLEDCDGYGTGRAIVPLYAHPPVSALVNAQADADVVERWQPIETAPRDWTDVLLYLPDEDDGTGARGVVKGWFSMKDGGFDCWFGCGINSESNADPCSPTHWMPLPAPPALSSLRPAEVGSATDTSGIGGGDA